MLPDVEQVHVVDGRLASLDLKDDAGRANRTEVVRPKSARLVGSEQPLSLVPEAQPRRLLKKHL